MTKLLLINPPAYDYRLEWAKWHQPLGLLQIGAMLRSRGFDIKLLDCLNFSSRQIRKKKLGTHEISGYNFHKWRFGLPEETVRDTLCKLQRDWYPDMVLVSSLNSVWWEGVRDTVSLVKKYFPDTQIFCGGAYPTAYPEHANQNIPISANNFFRGAVAKASSFQPDISLYDKTPLQAGILYYNYANLGNVPEPRPVDEIVREIIDKARLGVTNFGFFDEEILPQHHDELCNLLDHIAKEKLKNRRISLMGNISPKLITPDVAKRLRPAYVREIFFRCNIDFNNPKFITYQDQYNDYDIATRTLEKFQFRPRSGEVTAMLVAGFPYEDIADLTERTITLAHIVGSVIVVPYQYSPGQESHPLITKALNQNGHFTPEMWNSKLFPLARLSGKKIEEYIELLRLTRLLNSKYRSVTFDFLGDSLTANLFRQSINSEGYTLPQTSEGTAKSVELTEALHDR